MKVCALLLQAVFAIVFIGAFSSCASVSDTRLGTEPETPLTSADPSTYGTDYFTFSKNQKRREANDFMFYYKNCQLAGQERSYYSRTTYWCSDP